MTIEEFRQSATQSAPPPGLPAALVALWHDAHGDWTAAHETAQEIDDPIGAWIHAYLHRKEGDQGNAAYWYRRADRPVCRTSLDVEWTEIAGVLLRNL